MAEAIRMPLLSDTMTEGVIAEWHKKVGDEVKADDVIADVETDKATMEVTPYVDGTLLYIAADKGKGVPVNGIMAIIGKPGEDFQEILDEDNRTKAAANVAKAASAQVAAAQAPQAVQEPAQQAPVVAQQPVTVPEPSQATPPAQSTPTATAAPKPAVAAPVDATVVRMPLLSDTMTEGKIVAWHKKIGDSIKSDDVIADVETDKATMEVMPYADGTLLYIGVTEGNAAKINEIIAIVGKAGTDISSLINESASGNQNTTEQQPAQQQVSEAKPVEVQIPEPAQSAPQHAEAHNTAETGDERLKASPLARKLAADKGIDIQALKGTGDGGRIVKRDIESWKPAQIAATPQPREAVQKETPTAPTAPAQQTPPTAPALVAGKEEYTDIPLTQMRKIIAQRLAESKFSAPHFYLNMTITMDKAMESRKYINEVSTVKVSFNDLVIKSVAMSLRKHPQVNSSWMGDFIRQNHHINIGTAVAVDEGLIVPVIKFADRKSLSEIAGEASVLIGKARNKKIQPHEFTGNTFTISNLGMMDIDDFTAIINPPDACILAVGKITATPVVEDGAVVIRNLMKVTLSCDHRVVDGAVGSRFLQTLKAYLENPVTMLA